jgi:hypothetical protein
LEIVDIKKKKIRILCHIIRSKSLLYYFVVALNRRELENISKLLNWSAYYNEQNKIRKNIKYIE